MKKGETVRHARDRKLRAAIRLVLGDSATQVAEQVGLSRTTIWRMGKVLPQHRGQILEIWRQSNGDQEATLRVLRQRHIFTYSRRKRAARHHDTPLEARIRQVEEAIRRINAREASEPDKVTALYGHTESLDRQVKQIGSEVQEQRRDQQALWELMSELCESLTAGKRDR